VEGAGTPLLSSAHRALRRGGLSAHHQWLKGQCPSTRLADFGLWSTKKRKTKDSRETYRKIYLKVCVGAQPQDGGGR